MLKVQVNLIWSPCIEPSWQPIPPSRLSSSLVWFCSYCPLHTPWLLHSIRRAEYMFKGIGILFGSLELWPSCLRRPIIVVASFLLALTWRYLQYLRIVDKYSVHPPTTCVLIHLGWQANLKLSTSYTGPEFTSVLEKPIVEYRQANLTVPGMSLLLRYHSFVPTCL